MTLFRTTRAVAAARSVVLLVASFSVGLGCGDRNPVWDRAPGADTNVFGLQDAVALVDTSADRVLMLTTTHDLNLLRESVPIQRQVLAQAIAPDRSKLFILTAGDSGHRPPDGQAAQSPALEVIAHQDGTSQTTRYPLAEPLTGLALDPQGQWAVLYANADFGTFVTNPNELLLVDLRRGATGDAAAAGGGNPQPHVLRSFGGRPQRFTFTDTLDLPGGPRRLLIVETEQDVAILDLNHPQDPEITIQLTSGQDARQVRPAGLAVTDGDPGPGDTRLAVRLEGDTSLVVATLVAATGRDFRPEINLTDVGGVPSDVAFVRTDNNALALAALVPSRNTARLIDPATGVAVDVALPGPYQRLSLVTAQVAPATADVALLWDASEGGVAFWELGRSAGQPYRAVETVGVTDAITSVTDVGGLHPELKILGTKTNTLFLLSLATRESSPFSTAQAGVETQVSRDGDRAWAFVPWSRSLSAIDLVTRHPQGMDIDHEIGAVFDIDSIDGHRSLVVWDRRGNQGVTIYDAQAVADTDGRIDQRRNVSGLLLEDL